MKGSSVFIVTFTLLIAVVGCSVLWPHQFLSVMESYNTFIGVNFGWIFGAVGLFLLGACVYVFFSPLGKKTIGGEGAEPLLSDWNWFSITLCTTIAAGILFWSACEPVLHFVTPPEFLYIEGGSYEASVFSMSTMYVHWGFTPYAIYCAPALIFSYVHYNLKKPYSFNSSLMPLFGESLIRRFSKPIDILCLFVTGTGLAASLGTGIMSVSGGLSSILGISSGTRLWIVIGSCIVITFVISSASGLMKGIRYLSDFNVRVFIALLVYVLVMGPTAHIFNLSMESFGIYLSDFFVRGLITGAMTGSSWPRLWTVAYFASWLAWAPLVSMFLGKIAYGQTYKKFVVMNLFLPALFSMIWVSILGGTSIYFQQHVVDLFAITQESGIEHVLYKIFAYLPFSQVTIPLLVATVFLSFVTAADSTTSAMANLSIGGDGKAEFEPPVRLKIAWGLLLGTLAMVMIVGEGVLGVKMLSTIAGFPATFLLLLSGISLVKVARNPDKAINRTYQEKEKKGCYYERSEI